MQDTTRKIDWPTSQTGMFWRIVRCAVAGFFVGAGLGLIVGLLSLTADGGPIDRWYDVGVAIAFPASLGFGLGLAVAVASGGTNDRSSFLSVGIVACGALLGVPLSFQGFVPWYKGPEAAIPPLAGGLIAAVIVFILRKFLRPYRNKGS